MTDEKNNPDQASLLRKQAEERARKKAAQMPENLESLPPEETHRLLHELRVHQIELEMQNEELRRAQDELESSRAQYFDLYDLAPVGYVTISEKGLILQANLTAGNLLGATRSDLAGQPFSAFISSEDQDVFYLRRKKLLETRELQIFELRMARKNMGLFWARIEMAAARDAGGSIVCRAVLSDITERKDIEKARIKYLEQDKMAAIGKVAGKIAHDFNNLLGIIMGTGELLQAGGLPPEMSADIDIIIESALKGRDLTRNLLLFAKDQELNLSQFDLNERISQIIRSMKADLKGVKVTFHYGANMESALADAGLLENALINMIQNSIHAMSKTEKPELSIKTYLENNNICIEISDNGCGIPAEWMDKIFEPSVSLKGSGDRIQAYRGDIKGSGYGLSNVKRCVDKHGGTIELESKSNKGASFKITLPMFEGDISEKEIEMIREHDVVEGQRILIVEDEPHFAKILCSLLEKFNHDVTLAADGATALAHIRNNSFDAISLDFILPDMNGLDVYGNIRENNKDVPVIFVSGNFEFMKSMMDLKREDPRVDHLAKPFSNKDYVNVIHRWLKKDSEKANTSREQTHV